MRYWPLVIIIFSALITPLTAIAALPTNDLSSISEESKNTQRHYQLKAGSIIALTSSLSLNGRHLESGSELIVDHAGELSFYELDKNDPKKEELVELGLNIRDLHNFEFIVLSQDETTGEILPYNLPLDFQYAGPMVKKTKRSGITNCYRVVKRLVKDRISLWGVAAYMAAAQLKDAGWQRYSDYESAPEGSVCVFNKGGIPTSSGGHIYGHVGVKGASGIANPTSGFRFKRPFLGCWNEV